MTENEAIKEIETSLELAEMCEPNREREKEIKGYKIAIQALEEIQQYRAIGLTPELIEAMQGHNVALINDLGEYQAIGTVEELQKAKMQYDDINSVAEKTALIGLSDYGTAKEAVITEIKRSLDYSLKEYQKIGTVEEIKHFFNENRKAGYKHGYSDGYAKAIDEFAEKLIQHISQMPSGYIGSGNVLIIAEQMKAGAV